MFKSYGQRDKSIWISHIGYNYGLAFKNKLDYSSEEYGIIYSRNDNVIGQGGRFSFQLERKNKLGINLAIGGVGFGFNNEKFDENMSNTYGSTYVGLNSFSLYGSYTSRHGLRLTAITSTVYGILRNDKLFNFLVEGGIQFTANRNSEYYYTMRTPQTNYFEIIEVTNKLTGLKPILKSAIGCRLRIIEKTENQKNRIGFISLRLAGLYGFESIDKYTIKISNQRDEESEVNVEMPGVIRYLNLELSFIIPLE